MYWKDIIVKYKINYKQILSIIEQDIQLGKNIFPKKENIFRALNITSFNNTKVVILGQDPYHKKDIADGLAFSTQQKQLPSSLKNIFKEIKNDIGISITNGNLEPWAKRGVLLLNTIFTVVQDKPLSHANIGWEVLSSCIITELSKNKKNLVFILLGKKAQEYKKFIYGEHKIFLASHPSGLSAHISFFGSKIFSNTNKYLMDNNIKQINWSI